MAKLLGTSGILADGPVEDIAKAKQTKVETQYYVEQEQNLRTIRRHVEAACTFVLETEKTV